MPSVLMSCVYVDEVLALSPPMKNERNVVLPCPSFVCWLFRSCDDQLVATSLDRYVDLSVQF